MSNFPSTGALPRLPLSTRRDVDHIIRWTLLARASPTPIRWSPWAAVWAFREPVRAAPSRRPCGHGHGRRRRRRIVRSVAQRDERAPSGDLRMALAALTSDDSRWGRTWRDVMQHRFSDAEHPNEGLDNHALKPADRGDPVGTAG